MNEPQAEARNFALAWYIAAGVLSPFGGLCVVYGLLALSDDWLFGNHPRNGAVLLSMAAAYLIACIVLLVRGKGRRNVGPALGVLLIVMALLAGAHAALHAKGDPFQ